MIIRGSDAHLSVNSICVKDRFSCILISYSQKLFLCTLEKHRVLANHFDSVFEITAKAAVDEFELNCIYSRSEVRVLGYNTPISLRLHRILQIP